MEYAFPFPIYNKYTEYSKDTVYTFSSVSVNQSLTEIKNETNSKGFVQIVQSNAMRTSSFYAASNDFLNFLTSVLLG